MSKKCVAFSKSKLGLETADNRKSFYAGWDAALAEQAEQEPVANMEVFSGWEDVANVEVFEDIAAKLPDGNYMLYAAPVRTKDLTDEEIAELFGNEENWTCDRWSYERAVITADREKNK